SKIPLTLISLEVLMPQFVQTVLNALTDIRLRSIGLMLILTLAWACYRQSQVSYSSPQELAVSQWMIEFKPSESQVQLTMRYSRQRDKGGFGYNSHGFNVPFEQLTGLT